MTTDVLARIIEAPGRGRVRPAFFLSISKGENPMNDRITRDNLFRAPKSRADTKADLTDQTARAIVDAEVEGREAKTARLRQARLEMEARSAQEPSPAKPQRSNTPAPTRTRRSR
ncbi:hypothetical protein CF98_30650 [Halopseudomonas bauzanensis]|nr:hypothetical protein CF98_30650 [Halopseudomonas bauzanensis]